MIVASITSNVLLGIGVGTGVIVFMMMASEISRPLPDLPKIFWRYPMSYISFATWAIQGQFKNEMIGLEFDPLLPGNPKLTGEKALQTIFGVPIGHSKWWDLSALICLLLVHRILFYIILKYKKRAIIAISPRVLHTRRTPKWLSKRVSLASKVYKPLHPQEGTSTTSPN
ncbi:hypothetical protein JCGZ_21108 [Jatropha curcas]|uniref:ABC-2 type transporter transmembrane domain-containing protein n=1 Tax=Jatropha curcas TaxID=180498 RepID=A0A067K1E5_JATCU|nr:hypothetical protein JCGZ_21108 [Jatropha curcas]